MDEIYRMMGREHELDLAREAEKRSRAAAARRREPGRRLRRVASPEHPPGRSTAARVVAFLIRRPRLPEAGS
jgi:hypothetical protein